MSPQKLVHKVYGSITHDSPKMETTQTSINDKTTTDKQDVDEYPVIRRNQGLTMLQHGYML